MNIGPKEKSAIDTVLENTPVLIPTTNQASLTIGISDEESGKKVVTKKATKTKSKKTEEGGVKRIRKRAASIEHTILIHNETNQVDCPLSDTPNDPDVVHVSHMKKKKNGVGKKDNEHEHNEPMQTEKTTKVKKTTKKVTNGDDITSEKNDAETMQEKQKYKREAKKEPIEVRMNYIQ